MKVTEGPHLYKKDGWYYLFAAEGGTVYEHQESVARSRTLDERSFEVMPNGPFIGNFDTPDTYLQKQGHGALVDTPSGEWYYASLCGRPWRHERTEPAHGHPHGAHSDARPPSRKSNGMRTVGRAWSEGTADSVTLMLRKMPSRLWPQRRVTNMMSSIPASSVRIGTLYASRSPTPWARW